MTASPTEALDRSGIPYRLRLQYHPRFRVRAAGGGFGLFSSDMFF